MPVSSASNAGIMCDEPCVLQAAAAGEKVDLALQLIAKLKVCNTCRRFAVRSGRWELTLEGCAGCLGSLTGLAACACLCSRQSTAETAAKLIPGTEQTGGQCPLSSLTVAAAASLPRLRQSSNLKYALP